MRGPSSINIRHRPWTHTLLGILLSIAAVSAAPLDLNHGGRGSWKHRKVDRIEKIQEVQGQLYDGSSMVYATELPTGPLDQTPTTASIILLGPSTSAEALPISTTSSDQSSTSEFEVPTSTSMIIQSSTSTESTEVLPGETSSTFTTSTSILASSTSSLELQSSSSSSTTSETAVISDISTASSESSTFPSSSATTTSSPEAFAPTLSSETTASSQATSSTVVPDVTTSTKSTSTTSMPAYDSRTSTSEVAVTTTISSVGDISSSTRPSDITTTTLLGPAPRLSSNPFNVPGFVTIPVPTSLTVATTSLMSTSTSEIASDSTSTSTIVTSIMGNTSISSIEAAPVPTGTPEFGPGFSFIRLPGAGGGSSLSIAPASTTSEGVTVTTSLGLGNGMTTTTTTSQIYNMPTGTTTALDSYTTEISLPIVVPSASTSTSLAAFLTTTSEPVTSSSLFEVSTSSSTFEPSSSPSSQVTTAASSSEAVTSTFAEPVTTEEAIPVETGGIPDLILPSSSPEGYAPYPTDGTGGTTSSAENEPVQTTPSSSSSTLSDSLPKAPSPEPSSAAVTGTPGAPPDLVLPTTTSLGFGTNTIGGGGDYMTTAVSPAPSSLEATESSSSALQDETSSAEAPPPTTVFVTVVVPTAPTATVTQTVYPSLSPSAPETSPATETVAPTNDYSTAILTGPIGSPPDLVIPTSFTESFAPSLTSGIMQSSSTSSTMLVTTTLSTLTTIRSTTTVLQTVIVTSTKNVVYTTYSTVVATAPLASPEPTQPEIIPVPTESDILTTVFETQTAPAVLTTVPPSDRHSNVPEFGNVISVTISVSYPAPLFPIPAEPDSTDIHTTVQLSSTFQRVGVSTPTPSAPFTYIQTTIPYPYPTQIPNADTSPTSVATSSSPPVRTGFVIPGIISRQDISVSRAASTIDISNSGAAAPTTLSTAIVMSSDRTPSVKPRSVYTPVAVSNVKKAPAQVLEARSSAPQNQAAFAPVVFILIAVAFSTSFVA
ncbi:hypothetical protein ABW21_db0206997 [Orbilia brochopaga]|nr:hypothetical protein ABW21_db0206997 [Drechslerella brochopaga]